MLDWGPVFVAVVLYILLTPGLADSDTGSPAISRVWQLSDQWSFHTGSLRPLLCSHLHFLVSCWCPRVCRFIAFEGMGRTLLFCFPFS
ncbi:hypothetical protein OIU74_001026 [Salix koriyanagi]|uniref:Secreted protein n=1 Tax=Salix koriyanagi TaxID=2511006 RepID=A0A9Q1AMZ3_9ROSI|nr:hypothetical protein OIU74_001026 [Salix koriyanagi]